MKNLILSCLLLMLSVACHSQGETQPMDGLPHGLFTPVEFTKLTVATNVEDANVLTWYTASEFNNSHFTIQSSTSGSNWDIIGTVPGYGTTRIPQKYVFTDYSKITGPLYYKLNQYDYDGNTTQLAIIQTSGFNDYTNLYGFRLQGRVQSIQNITYNSTINLMFVNTDKRSYKLYVPSGY